MGLIQGLTEFLPVSSSGHLVLGQKWFGLTEPALFFDISVHMGTLGAVLVVFFPDIKQLVSAFFRVVFTRDTETGWVERIRRDEYAFLVWLIMIGSVPTALIGLFLKRFEHLLFSSLLLVGCMLIVTGFLLWVSRFIRPVPEKEGRVTVKRAILLGIVQGLAVIPGISRSGATIVAGTAMGIERSLAARFSFLLSIPAILGAQLLGIRDLAASGGTVDMAIICGTIAAFLSGWCALVVLLNIVKAGRFYLFAPYCWFVGALAILAAVI